jgi:hypothetical protein
MRDDKYDNLGKGRTEETSVGNNAKVRKTERVSTSRLIKSKPSPCLTNYDYRGMILLGRQKYQFN